MNTIYSTRIENIGTKAKEFFEANMFITFKQNAPQELIDYCFIHSENNLVEEIKAKDILCIDDVTYEVKAVGELVNQNLKDLGHITYNFLGEEEAKVAGTLYLEKKEIAPIGVGTIIKIIRK
ncbi:PTS glucitol/sorbitol transporter subunit IIA [Clostridium uliginosum]|uniref:PTS system, glucitol/sorbitol-specific IIA component n=1 Tax=Clostridium uliginosum TaxID=119641 RepID=A0A1I1JB92_9CLOT|nr:PTS glucitol/sorbitol transporter subunit IIA [Clostridium uliginosum]SFC43868.1 PTS system, glucitol/sorbitol-specific IIA component [Clostridium uliginosum]